MEQFNDLVQKKGVVSALRDEAAAALSHPRETIDSLKKPIAETAVTVGALYLAHRFGPAAVEKGAEVLRPIARELGASLDIDAFSHFGPKLALADGIRLGERSALTSKYLIRGLKNTETDLLHKPLEMTSSGGTGGGAGGVNMRSWMNSAGEREHAFDNVQVGNNFNFFPHADGSQVVFHPQGGLFVNFANSAEYRTLDFGRPIKTVNIKEGRDGINEYRFNGENRVALRVSPQTHDIAAYLANGDRTIIADNSTSGIVFTHSRGGTIRVGTGGQVEVVPPDRPGQTTSVRQPFKQAYFTEHPDGSASLRFTDANGTMIQGAIQAPAELMKPVAMPNPQTLRPNNLTPQQGPRWSSPLQRQSPVRPDGSYMDWDTYDAGARGHRDAINPFNIPMSPERAIDARITGVSGGMVSNNRLDSPADMFTAQTAGGNRWLGRFLINLGKPERFKS